MSLELRINFGAQFLLTLLSISLLMGCDTVNPKRNIASEATSPVLRQSRTNQSSVQDCFPNLKIPNSFRQNYLSSPSCLNDKPIDITIYGETHQTPHDRTIKDVAVAAHHDGKLITMLEQRGSSDHPLVGTHPKGFEPYNGFLEYTTMGVFGNTYGLLNTQKGKQKQIYERMLINSLWGLYHNRSDWTVVRRPFPKTNQENLAKKIDKFFKIARKGYLTKDIESFLRRNKVDPKILVNIISPARKKILDRLMKTDLMGFERSQIEQAASGAGREVFWLKAVIENLCEVKKLDLPLWLHMGVGHTKNMRCALQNILGENAKIKVDSAESEFQQKKIMKWEKQPAFQGLKRELNQVIDDFISNNPEYSGSEVKGWRDGGPLSNSSRSVEFGFRGKQNFPEKLERQLEETFEKHPKFYRKKQSGDNFRIFEIRPVSPNAINPDLNIF